ncbi:sulfite exporter TauE/SafE family protein [Microbispora sp. H10885]|uniref:urease accessory protein UreH domain-containing protein n=1 Tax=Microbispora sp. H10885 TaxID=2729110 RepID=UPI0015FF2F00|nr:sulfite exporter TauE/SafE family protein [Microbispora sp. H10885]
MNPAALFAGGLVAGLAAGTASCAAVQGGLLIGLVSPGPPGATGAAGTAGTGRASRTTGASRTTRDVRDALPAVAAFLTGRLAAHTALGALLGLAGSAVRLGPQTRAALLVAAGIAVTVLAVRMLARRGRAGCAAAPPGHLGCSDGDTQDTAHASTARTSTAHTSTAHTSTAHAGTARAAGLGLTTILMPCGVTVSLEVVAVSAGSAPGGAAVLAGLALGTAPALAALGLLLRGLATTRLAALGGVAALAAGLFTAGSGLRLGDWLPEIGSPAAAAARASIGADGVQRLTIWATDRGFRPGVAVATAGRPVEIVFRTSGDRGCTRAVAVDGRDVVLPVTGARTVRLPARPEGRLRYACGMGMYVGFIEFERPLTSTSSR